jgi:hypothetical protein
MIGSCTMICMHIIHTRMSLVVHLRRFQAPCTRLMVPMTACTDSAHLTEVAVQSAKVISEWWHPI